MATTDSPPLVSMAQQFTGLPMQALIGGPLNAAAKANGMMGAMQTKFLLDTAFASKTETKNKVTTTSYTPVMITMALTRSVIVPPEKDGDQITLKQVTATFDLPLLTILPLNSLGVDNVTITFDMEVKSSYAEDTSEATKKDVAEAGSFDAKFSYGPFSAEIKGSASYNSSSTTSHDTHYQKSNSAHYSVNVHAGQLPLPDGVKTIITAFTNSISPIEMPVEPTK
jgi:Protein of unknown function (DUF2589)